MTMKKILGEAEFLPWGYAVAYWSISSHTAVCYPVGVHLLVSGARQVYLGIARARFGKRREAEALHHYRKGYDEGRASIVGERLLRDDFESVTGIGHVVMGATVKPQPMPGPAVTTFQKAYKMAEHKIEGSR